MHWIGDFFAVMAHPMAIVGVAGQSVFFSRFLVQWLASEKAERSVIPDSFWYLSLCGGLLTLVYAIWRRDPIFTVAQTVGLFVYVRNIVLVRNERRKSCS
jgi:lipid-A-disaccharide synthase-like uncharacterized protein